MNRAIPLLGLLLTLAAPAAAQASDPAPLAPNALDFLLERGDELELAPDQIEGLRGIQARLQLRNRPLVERLLEIRRRWLRERPVGWVRLPPRARRVARERFEAGVRDEVRTLRAAILRHHREAILEARDLLTPDQRAQARALLRDDARPPP